MKAKLIWGVAGATAACVAWAGASRLEQFARLAARAPSPVAAAPVATAQGDVVPAGAPLNSGSTPSTRLSSHARAVGQEVGDPGSFGRPVRFLGLMTTPAMIFSSNCGSHTGPSICIPVDYATGTAEASFPDIATQTLPAHSMQNLLCHWATPFIAVTFNNRTSTARRRHSVQLRPTITLENPWLVLPHRTNPSTGAPLAGSITFGLAAGDVAERLDPNETWNETFSSTRTCFGGNFTRAVLANQYGLSESEIRAVYASPTQLRMRLDVSATGVSSGNVGYFVRWVGD